ncbi:inactive protein RESTRICTED TEV MOVEMENT 2-like [Glycine max]|uniref:inactive protein RESTRICTED TEV MOVEMENT 2-like n=1 Tax=Glycine max TaxID=3847 RepID=UPI0007193D4F|nr:inactive protein RESTRICTED TEV MOVEMENT 2-like [Glycine max]
MQLHQNRKSFFNMLKGFAREHIGAKTEYDFGRVRVYGERSLGNNRRARFNALYQVPEFCDINKIKGKFDGKTVIITIPTIPGKVPKKETQPTEQEPPKEPSQETESNPEEEKEGTEYSEQPIFQSTHSYAIYNHQAKRAKQEQKAGKSLIIDDQQWEEIPEKVKFVTLESQDKEVIKLKKQLSEFIEQSKVGGRSCLSLSTVGLPQLTNDEINPTDGTLPTLDRKPCESLAGKVEVVRRNEEVVE